ncbi:hypothetical protein GJAV_G00248790 [Gymnothorax javanicus]|nr:hypothetical protein GJAV_G00248790 [Gymnothorax javanicus]
MSNSVLHKQLASIIEVLAKTAVAEICRAVDDGFAVLRLEMSQSKKENDALRRKLRLTEQHGSYGCHGKTRIGESMAKHQLDEPHFSSEIIGTTEDSYFSLGQNMATSPLRDGDHDVLAVMGSPVHPVRHQCADMQARTESVLIKEESVEEERDLWGEIKTEDERSLEWRAGSREKRPVQEAQNKAVNHTEELTEQHRTRRAVWECAVMEEGRTESLLIKEERLQGPSSRQGEQNKRDKSLHFVLRSCDSALILEAHNSPEGEAGIPRAEQETWEVSGPEMGSGQDSQKLIHRAEVLSGLGSEIVLFERAGHQGSYCAQGSAFAETEDPCCSYSTEMGAQGLSFHSELHPSPPIEEQGTNALACLHSEQQNGTDSVHSLYLNAGDVNDSVKMATDTHTALDKSAMPGPALKKYRLDREPTDGETIELLNGVTKYPSHTRTPEKEHQVRQAHSRPDTSVRKTYSLCEQWASKSVTAATAGERVFICTHCGKSFSRPRNLETHLRVHTGEKPFSCTQCGKRFSQLSSLKTHLSVHTGERPFRCAQCGKRFAQPGYLKRHQTVHTGEKPFRCTQCEKSFSFLSNLIRHQGLHTAGKAYTGSL